MKQKRKLPVVIRIYKSQKYEADLLKEVQIHPQGLNKQLRKAPAKYSFWAGMYSAATKKVKFLEEKLEFLESKLFIRYAKDTKRATDIKHLVTINPKVQVLKAQLRRWRGYENDLKFGERSFDKYLFALQSLNANRRKEFQHQ